MRIISKVIRDNYRHITRADYGDVKPLLGSENVLFPKVSTLQARALRRSLPAGRTLSHRSFDFETHSYRLGSYIGSLRNKGWPFVDHDETALTRDAVHRQATFTNYELFAEFTLELQERINAFCKAVDDFEAQAMGKAA